jgi:lipopolysaccharide transport system ATP-binding protein
MSDAVISVEQLGKKYQIDHLAVKGSYKTLRETLTHQTRDLLSGWFSRNGNGRAPKRAHEEFWALKDVSFEVKQGEVLGIIGRNGAGKSTLLKILSRITEPTEGRVRIRGRVASLLEVGTGFHPELTGRENIYLNGAILGMAREEIKRKFDQIVDFAGTEKFLDTPVKRYSSGMYVRLAFAVAAHMEPEILIVDEVLAVGDAEFQKKCLGKMEDVSRGGRTVLFVSHNMLAIQRLCNTAVYFEKGQCKAIGSVDDIIENYVLENTSDSYLAPPSSSNETRILSVKILTASPRTDRGLEVEIEWFLHEPMPGTKIGIGFNSSNGERIFSSTPTDVDMVPPHEMGIHRAIYSVPANTFLGKAYTVAIALWGNGTVFDYPNPALAFTVEAAPTGPYSDQDERDGMVSISGRWNIHQ